ncbi:MAG: FtsX-like permease family protein [Chloroflexi bacterium]|nr:FtsX-like permease family protein [Chloroflexota bacterium]
MDSLFGVQLTSILAGLFLIVAVVLGLLTFIGLRNPLLVRMGLRNVVRRKTQTVLIVIGLMLSTLIISAAFATGDTVAYSITASVYDDFGEADIVAAFDRDLSSSEGRDGLRDSDVQAVRDWFADNADVDAITGVIQTPVPALNAAQRLSEPQALLVGVDATTDGFHGLVTADDELLLAADLGPDDAYISIRLAEDINLVLGDQVTIFVENAPYTFNVAGIVRDTAMTASTPLTSDGNAAGGIVARLDRVREIIQEPDRVDLVVISARGTVRDTLDLVEGISNSLETLAETQGVPLSSVADKDEIVAQAELIGSFFVTFFLVFGLFSIAAGIMLIFLTFVMLAAERRSEMGMARAIGLKRLHLTESFIAEGMTYNLGSAFVGALLGLVVAYGLIQVMGSIFDDFGFSIGFHVGIAGFLVSYFLGVVITFFTVAGASWRAANLNIVRAIRDIPEPQPLRGKDTSIGALLKGAVGALWYVVWIAIAVLAAALLFFAFIFSLTQFGLPLIGAALVIGGFIAGLRLFGRARTRPQTVALVVWWVAFLPVLASPIAFGLLKTKSWADRNRNSGGWALVMLAIGSLGVWWGGWIASQAFAYTAGFTLMVLATAMLLVYFGWRTRRVFTVASFSLLWFWLLPLPFSLFFEDGKGWNDPVNGLFGLIGLGHEPVEGNIEMFFVSGICITAASTLFVVFNADRLLGSVGALQGVFGGIAPAIRTAISYPLASKFRTGMALAMFTLVMFSLVVMATLNYNFTQFFLGEGAKGGFEVQVTANPNNRIGDLRTALTEAGDNVGGSIRQVGTERLSFLDVRPIDEPADEYHGYQVASIDQEFLQAADFPLSAIATGYADQAAVMDALANDPTVAIATETILSRTQSQNFESGDDQLSVEGSITDLQANPWQPIPLSVRNAETGGVSEVRIIGFVDSVIISGVVTEWFAIFTHESLVPGLAPDDFREVYFVNTTDGTDEAALALARGIESTLLEQGVQAESLNQLVEEAAGQSTAFSNLFQGFMSLGLIVGIAALGVIAFRTVAERRQQIGMLRAIGYTRRLVAISFFLESSFIAVTGVAMGAILGAALSYNLLTSPEFTNGAEIEFGIPWGRLALFVGIAYVASAIMTLLPARSASRVSVAEALRYE